jgi:heme exporter protein C
MPIVLKPEKPSLPPEMLITFLIALGSYFVLFFAFLRVRYAIATGRALAAAKSV